MPVGRECRRFYLYALQLSEYSVPTALFSLSIYICANADDPAVLIFPPFSCLKKTVAPFAVKIIIFEFTNVFSLSFLSRVVSNYLLLLYLNIYAMKWHCVNVQFNLKSLNLKLSRMQPLLLRIRSIDLPFTFNMFLVNLYTFRFSGKHYPCIMRVAYIVGKCCHIACRLPWVAELEVLKINGIYRTSHSVT